MGKVGFGPRSERGHFFASSLLSAHASKQFDVNTTATAPSNRLIDNNAENRP
jgi:hypothetical protein